MIIEFNGIVGCGKSTIAKELYAELKKNEALRVEYYTNPIAGKGLMTQLMWGVELLITRFVSLENKQNLLHMFSMYHILSKSNGLRINGNIRQLLSTIAIILYADEYKKRDRILIVDQGVLQGIMSTLWNVEYDNESIASLICGLQFADNWKFIDCVVKEEIAMDRIESRTCGESRIEQLDASLRQNALCNQSELLKYIRTYRNHGNAKVILLDTEKETPVENCRKILEELRIG